MDITRTPGDGRVRLALRGRLDAAWSNAVQEALADCVRAGQHDIELDLAEVVFLSSAGIRVLLLTYRQLHAIRGRLSIVACSTAVLPVIELSGLRALLAAADDAAPAPAEARGTAPRCIERDGARYEVDTLDAQARMAVQAVGDPATLLERGALADLVRASFPAARLAVGVGAFGATADECRPRLGELLAVAGAAITLPTSGEGRPDWLVCEARLVPEAYLAYGLIAEGRFAHAVRFESAADAGPLPVEALVSTALDVAGAEAIALAVVAETAQFVGAALRRSPDGCGRGIFGFPGIRDQLDFTAEAAYADSVGVIAGVAARRAPAPIAVQLRPLDRDGALAAHLHAAVFPYRPIPRGRIALDETVRGLFDAQNVVGLLHLLHDWRPGAGAGQTTLRRGALWCAPLAPVAPGGPPP